MADPVTDRIYLLVKDSRNHGEIGSRRIPCLEEPTFDNHPLLGQKTIQPLQRMLRVVLTPKHSSLVLVTRVLLAFLLQSKTLLVVVVSLEVNGQRA